MARVSLRAVGASGAVPIALTTRDVEPERIHLVESVSIIRATICTPPARPPSGRSPRQSAWRDIRLSRDPRRDLVGRRCAPFENKHPREVSSA
jgi:hypothetical protein